MLITERVGLLGPPRPTSILPADSARRRVAPAMTASTLRSDSSGAEDLEILDG
jgi:hypothetical protein